MYDNQIPRISEALPEGAATTLDDEDLLDDWLKLDELDTEDFDELDELFEEDTVELLEELVLLDFEELLLCEELLEVLSVAEEDELLREEDCEEFDNEADDDVVLLDVSDEELLLPSSEIDGSDDPHPTQHSTTASRRIQLVIRFMFHLKRKKRTLFWI